uniref:Myb-like domain-containing protein n=1 Tax=Chaetoceros debilis TaxID=122233 RepID=A0A7S3Q1Q3_9STRA
MRNMNTGDPSNRNRSARKKTSRKRAAVAVSIPKPDRQRQHQRQSEQPTAAVTDNANANGDEDENENENENTAPTARSRQDTITITEEITDPTIVVDYSSLVVLTNKPKCKNHVNGLGQTIVPHMGKFTTHELEIIKKSVANFCASKNLPVSILAEGNGAKKGNQLRGIWAEVGKELPHRHIHTIYRCGLRLVHDCKRGEWTNEEIQELKMFHVQYGSKWVQIGKKLNRTPDCCRDKFRESGDDGKVSGRFTKEEIERFIKLLKKNLKLGQDATVEDMRKAHFEDGIAIPWEGLSGAMKTRSRLQCFSKWESLMKTPRKRTAKAKIGGRGQGQGKGQEGDSQLGKVDVRKRKRKDPATASDANDVEVDATKRTSVKVGGADNADGDGNGDGNEEASPMFSDASAVKKSKDAKKKKGEKKKKHKKKKKDFKSIASLDPPEGNDDIDKNNKKQEGDHLGRVDVRKRKRKLSSTGSGDNANANANAVEVDASKKTSVKVGGSDTSDRVDIRKRRKKEAKQQLMESSKPGQSLASKNNSSNEKEEGSNDKKTNNKYSDDDNDNENASMQPELKPGGDLDIVFDFDDGDDEPLVHPQMSRPKRRARKRKRKGRARKRSLQ